IQNPDTSHIIMSTHDPLVFSRLLKPQVRVFQRGLDGRAIVDEPRHDPRGMGIQAILASDLFRLPSGGLDSDTLRDVERQRELSMREDLSEQEDSELVEVTDRLNERGFWKQD